MDTKKQAALAAVENKKELLQQVADSIWAYAELSLQEYRSAALYEQVLEEEGFTVEKGICGIETAFSSSFGSERPVIGILGEYDALSGLSQAGHAIKETPLAPGAPGHGCGHNPHKSLQKLSRSLFPHMQDQPPAYAAPSPVLPAHEHPPRGSARKRIPAHG